MIDLKKIKDYSWILLIISTIFAILSLVIPHSFNPLKNRIYWTVGITYDFDTSEFFTTPTDIAVIGGIIETIILVMCIIFLISSILFIKFDKLSTKKIQLLILVSSILLMLVPILHYSIASAVIYDYYIFEMLFGFAAPIISSIIALPCIYLIKDT